MVHSVTRIDWSFADTPLPASATSSGLARQVLVGPAQGAVHTELAAGAFAPGRLARGATPTPSRRPCTCSRASSSSTSAATCHRLVAGDYSLMTIGTWHALANGGDGQVAGCR